MTQAVLGNTSTLEATSADSSLQALVGQGALEVLEEYAVKHQLVGTKEEVCALGIETLRSLLRLAAAFTTADAHSSTYNEASSPPSVVSPPVPSLSSHQQPELQRPSPQSTTPSPSCTMSELTSLLDSFANELGQEGQRDRARRSVLSTPPVANVDPSGAPESTTACNGKEQVLEKPQASPETPSTVATSSMSTPGTQTPPTLPVTPADAADPSHVPQSLQQQLKSEEEGRDGHSLATEDIKFESHRDAPSAPQTRHTSLVTHVPEVVHAPLGAGATSHQIDEGCSATQVTPERPPHVITDSVSRDSSVPESDALGTTPEASVSMVDGAEPCGEHDGGDIKIHSTPMVVEKEETQAPGGQKIMKVLTRKCRAFLGRRPFCRPPITPATSAAPPPAAATEGHDSTPSADEEPTVDEGFLSRVDVAEGRRLLGRFVIVKGPTLLEAEQGAVLRVREAAGGGENMALKLFSLGFKTMGDEAGWEVDLNHDRELMLCQRIQEAPRHPNLIHILHTGAFEMTVKTHEEAPDATTPSRVRMRVGFVLMPLLPCTLYKRLRRREGLHGTEADRVALGIFSGLAALRERDVVHSDFKPENILLTADGEPVIFDFGLAFIASQQQDPTGYVHAHLLSIEQLTHRPSPHPFLRSTFASDLWSAACIIADLYRRRRCPLFHLGDVKSYVADPWHLKNMTAGLVSAVFKSCEGRMHDHLLHHTRGDVDPRLVQLLACCLERDPEARPTAAEALAEMEQVLCLDSEEEGQEEEEQQREDGGECA